LKLETYNGEIITVGHILNNNKSKEFHLEIKSDEKPIMFFGGLAYNSNPNSSQEHVLVLLGIEIYNPKFINKFKKNIKGEI